MGIYISGVKGLPEQVQENKENIKDIQEEIEGIDFDAIHNLENQVAENTQDINNMEGTIGTQNIAITNLGGRVDDLEDKTQDISRQGSMLYIDTGSVVLNADLGFEDSGVNIKLNNENNGINKIVSAQDSNNFIDFDSSNNVHIMSDGGEYEFRDDTIYVNSSPIGGSTLYEHNIHAIKTAGGRIFMTIINDSPTPYTSMNAIRSWLVSKGFTGNNYKIANGVDGNNNEFVGIGTSGSNSFSLIGVSGTTTTINQGDSYTLYDNVVAL